MEPGQDEEGLTRVQLTLDGINIQQHFLVDEVKCGDWTVVKCKVGDIFLQVLVSDIFLQVHPA